MKRIPLNAALIPLLVWAVVGAGCARQDPEGTRRRTEAVVIKRQIEGLKALVAVAERGQVADPSQILIGVNEDLLNELLNANLPPETIVAGRIRVKVGSAEVRFQATTSIVILRARLSLVRNPDRFADVLLGGGLDEVQIDPATGRLTARVALFRVELEKTANGLLSPIVETLLHEANQAGLDALSATIPPLQIPIRLEPEIRIPGFGDGPVSVGPGQLPIHLSVARVVSLSGRLWIMLDAAAGPWQVTPDASPSPSASPSPPESGK